jgi:hypothetical protein
MNNHISELFTTPPALRLLALSAKYRGFKDTNDILDSARFRAAFERGQM